MQHSHVATIGPTPRLWSIAARRRAALAVLAAASVVLGVAAWLHPSAEGMGTHTQLMLPPCTWIAMADLPCPTCGMTTAFAHAADGNLLAAARAQPLGAALAVAMAMTWLIAAQVAVTGSRLGSVFMRLLQPRTGWWLAAAVIAAWGWKIAAYRQWL